jgi:hypothetical protein
MNASVRVFVPRELYRSGMTPEVMAQAVHALDDGGSLSAMIDSSAFADVGMGGGRAKVMNRLGFRWMPSAKGAGSRLAGKSAIHARLALRSDGLPGLMVFRNCCPNLVRTLPSLVYSATNPEDVDEHCEDHCFDALRYGLTRRTPGRMVPFHV